MKLKSIIYLCFFGACLNIAAAEEHKASTSRGYFVKDDAIEMDEGTPFRPPMPKSLLSPLEGELRTITLKQARMAAQKEGDTSTQYAQRLVSTDGYIKNTITDYIADLVLSTPQDIKEQVETYPNYTPNFKPVDLGGSLFANLTPAGSLGDMPNGATKKWSQFHRFFKTSKGDWIVLQEYPFGTEGGSILRIADYLNATVWGHKGTLYANTAPSGTVVWTLTWQTPKNSYHIKLRREKFNEADRDLILKMAESIKDRRI